MMRCEKFIHSEDALEKKNGLHHSNKIYFRKNIFHLFTMNMNQ